MLRLLAAVVAAALALAPPQSVAQDGHPPASADAPFRIVDASWLQARLDDPNLRILDVRNNSGRYLAGHIAGAVNLAESTMRAPDGGMPFRYLPPDDMAAMLQKAGVTLDNEVVLYSDSAGVLGSTMVAYCLLRIGHEQVRVLDGGIDDYASKYPLTQAYPSFIERPLEPRFDNTLFVMLDEVAETVTEGGATFIDARPPADYRGETSTWQRNGHIPGAISLDWHRLMDESNNHRYRPYEEIRAIFRAEGVTGDEPIIAYCGTSREATLLYLYMKHVLGFEDVRLFEGSWTEYCANPDLPVATGDGR
jgi:thiosulfate/3-mercaptopyruvate sulfurtransferase